MRHSVLVVDDSPTNLAILEDMLAANFRVVTAASGEEALDQAYRAVPDVALLDIILPDIDGYEVCRLLRDNPKLRYTKVIMISGKKVTVEDRLRGYRLGADDYLCKPFEQEELIAKIGVFLRLQSAEQVDRVKSDMFVALSKETQSPINHIVGPTAQLLKDPTLTKEQRDWVRQIQDCSDRLNGLCEKIQALSTLTSGKYVGHSAPCSVTPIVRHQIQRLATKAMSKGIEIVDQLQDDLKASVDKTDLKTAIATLLDNAIRFGKPDSQIKVSLAVQDEDVCIAVADQGPGMTAGVLAQVFRVFSAGDLDPSRGMHLGLPLAYHLIQLYGGTITAQSEPDQGSTFTIRLPKAGVARSQPDLVAAHVHGA